MTRYLSHILTRLMPVYGTYREEMQLRTRKSLNKGDSCQTYWLGMENHWGTHVDCPAHFFSEGLSVCDYATEKFIFKHPQVLEIPKGENQLIDIKDLDGKIDADADILLIKTGFQSYRDEQKYCTNNPGIKSEAGTWLRMNFKKIRSVGCDFISISAFQLRDEGRAAHKAFLDPGSAGNPILIIEDMNLSGNLDNIKEVWIAPLRIEGIDSAPCTVIGVFE